MANRNYPSGGKIYTGHVKPLLFDCNFVVDSTNGNGLGIRSLKGPYVQNVFMHTTQTPGAGNTNPATPNFAVTNPNPASGLIVVQFTDNFYRSYSGFNAIASPASGSALKIDNSALTAGQAYIITTLGNATAAKWKAIGVPAGVTPAVGVSFIAASNGGSGNTLTSRVMVASTSGITDIETVGDPNLSIAPSVTAQGFGAQMILQCLAPTIAVTSGTAGNAVTLNAGTTLEATGGGTVASTMAVTAPADGTVISLGFLLGDSSILLQGE